VEEPCSPDAARARWQLAESEGARGAVSSWGSGLSRRQTLRIFWEVCAGALLPEGEDLVEENWTPYWRKSLKIVPVSKKIVLVPAWEELPRAVPCSIRIDPGMAFGAGDHPTTRLCIRILEGLASSRGVPARVLDVGAGTGVLAIAAARLGAESVDALDIDPFGYAACRRNARLNGLEPKLRPLLLSLDLLEGSYPVILANMASNQLVSLAAHLKGHLEPGGRMILSGFEIDTEPSVRETLAFPVKDRWEEEGWVGLLMASD
jgi:ribosomal protein L11 methyltransferase